MAEENYGTETGGTGGGVPGGGGDDFKSEMSESDLIKLDLLRGLIAKHVNLSDLELAELTGFSSEKVSDIRAAAIRSTVDAGDAPLSWDYVLAFNVGSKEEKRKPTKSDLKNKPDDDNDPEWDDGMPQDKFYGQIFNNFWQRLEAAKLSVEAYRSRDKTLMFLVVGITEANLKVWADERDTDLLIDPVGGVEVGRSRHFALARRTRLVGETEQEAQAAGGIAPDAFNETLNIANWYYMYGEYSQHANQKVYKHYARLPGNDNLKTVFDEKTRLRIIYESIIADSNEGGAEIKIEDCLLHKQHPLVAVFPLHDQERLDYFYNSWIKNCNPLKWMWCPLPEIRNYFGEPVAFYFAFLQFYLKWLIAPAFVGTAFFIWQMAAEELAVSGIPFLCFFMIFWSVAFVDFWYRAESRYRLQWGMTKFQQKAVARPQFNGEWTHDSVTGLWIEEFSLFKRACRASTIYTFVVIWISGCVVSVVFVLLLRDGDPNDLGMKIALGVVNGVMIFVFDFIYKMVSKYGNEWENHRTEQDYQNALIAKSFIFKFINSFSSLFYLGFLRPEQKGLYYYTHFYTKVCEAAPSYVRDFMGFAETASAADRAADDITQWYYDYIADKKDEESYADCMAGDDTGCIEFVQDDDNDNLAWSIAVNGYSVDGALTAINCPTTYAEATDEEKSAGTCPGKCDFSETQIEQNEAVLSELQIQLLTLFLTAIIIQNTLEVGLPLIFEAIADRAKQKKQAKENNGEFFDETEVEDQTGKGPYANTIDDMSELVVQFGYVTLFVMAFPLTPLLAVVNNVIEMKVDAINLVKSLQRPHPNGSYGLGSWNSIIAVLSIIAVGTNVALITWRTKLVTEVLGANEAARWIFFSVLSIVLGIIVFIEKWIIPDVPIEVEQAVERQRLIESVLILGAGADRDSDEPPTDDSDGAIQFDPSLEFIDVETLPDIPLNNVRYAGKDP
mmetsp:Transcript_47156/g.75551  ORF Transcript_47156/g.75551 Transcript_47156/m.75551 type:complete len:954 (+) Transcript_47156:88-2949(+)|eukprot:CAMPEP_0197022536 /NCGR_PEP_ID=MMETSP1384-20130603/3377_1 /TAXON_ID=29189 /ORGANISM="Ammonia sp." /LENGTH=953 /DNA_ID=CAMNT_0042450595 /DNA_START=57 /DNA_END=2918 /DNA_ORIENTATION=-